jgi:hypothetical protein
MQILLRIGWTAAEISTSSADRPKNFLTTAGYSWGVKTNRAMTALSRFQEMIV